MEVIANGEAGQAGGRGQQTDNPTRIGGRDVTKRVAVILPETDEKGARTALDRLNTVLLNIPDVRTHLAVYPADSTDLGELLSLGDPMGS